MTRALVLPSLAAKTTLVGLATAGLLLTGCGQSSSTSSTPSSAPASSAPAAPVSATSAAPAPSTSASSSPTSSPTASPTSPSTPRTEAVPAAVKNVCKVIDLKAMEKLVGADLGKAKNTPNIGGSLCTYSATAKGQTIAVAAAGVKSGTLDKQAKDLQKSYGKGKLSHTTVSGTDEAQLLTADEPNGHVMGIIARKGGYDYAAIVGGVKGASGYEKDAKRVVTILFKS